jgi:hypothetical protein
MDNQIFKIDGIDPNYVKPPPHIPVKMTDEERVVFFKDLKERYYNYGHNDTVTLRDDNTFELKHHDMGIGMHDAERRENWTVKGDFTLLKDSVHLVGVLNGSTTGSRTDRVNCRVDHYTNTHTNDPYDKQIALNKLTEEFTKSTRNVGW